MNDNFFDEISNMAIKLGIDAAKEGIDVLKFFQDEDLNFGDDHFGLNEIARKSIEIGTSVFNSKGE